ncbi:MAG: glycosyltransferase family 39 protein [Desulfurobacteriaceae bacterium]
MRRESKILFLFLVILSISLLINLDVKNLFHEEPRRGIVAFEMIEKKDFLQPTVLGEPYFKKPPLHNWILVLSSFLVGEIGEFSLRFPSIVATILLVVASYFFVRKIFDSKVALLSSLITATTGTLLFVYSTKCEPDAFFTLFVFLSIFSWYTLFESGKRKSAWFFGYFFTSLAALTKGLPAFHFFYIAVISYVIVKRNPKILFSKEHLFGALGLFPFFSWIVLIPTEKAALTLFHEVSSRSPLNFSFHRILERYITFPFRFFISTLPWSLVVLVVLLKKKEKVKNLLKDERIFFLVLTLLGNLAVYWFFPGSRMRYTMPIHPIFAVIVAVFLKDFYLKRINSGRFLIFLSAILTSLVILFLIKLLPSTVILKNMLLFYLTVAIIFLYFRFFKTETKHVVVFLSAILLIFRSFYNSFIIPVSSVNKPPYREIAKEIVALSKGKALCSMSYNLKILFYVEKFRGEVVPLCKYSSQRELFVSDERASNILKEFLVGKKKIYLNSFTKNGNISFADSLKTKSQ